MNNQNIFTENEKVILESLKQVDKLDATERGDNGFGSTGR